MQKLADEFQDFNPAELATRIQSLKCIFNLDMQTKSYAYANNATEDSCTETPSWGPFLVSLITFSNTRLNRTGDIESPYLRPDFTIIGSVSASPTLTLMNVSIMLVSISFTNF